MTNITYPVEERKMSDDTLYREVEKTFLIAKIIRLYAMKDVTFSELYDYRFKLCAMRFEDIEDVYRQYVKDAIEQEKYLPDNADLSDAEHKQTE